MKVAYAIGFSVGFAVLLLIFYVVHVYFFPVDVVFYSALGDAFVAACVVGIGLAVSRVPLNGFEKILLVIVWLLAGYAFAITGPTLLDRSLSFYIIEKLQQRGGGIQRDQLAEVLLNEYMPEYRVIEMRLTEQQQSGTIKIEDGCVKLTEFGNRLATLSRFFRTHFLPKKRLIGDTYSDALVDPFAGSPVGQMNYQCH